MKKRKPLDADFADYPKRRLEDSYPALTQLARIIQLFEADDVGLEHVGLSIELARKVADEIDMLRAREEIAPWEVNAKREAAFAALAAPRKRQR